MKDYLPSTYGDRIADWYDIWYQIEKDPWPEARFLASLLMPAERRCALELGVGTGRVALALQSLGVDVTGIDASEAMLARLRAKPGGETVRTILGDFAEVPAQGSFPLIYVAFNTLFWLTSQQAQQRCLRNAAAHLDPDGLLVLDAFVPDVAAYKAGQRLTITELLGSSAAVDVSRHDPIAQTVAAAHVILSERGVQLYPFVIRYAWPAEIDAMAAAAGLTLVARWGDYGWGSFGPSSRQHVSVFANAQAP